MKKTGKRGAATGNRKKPAKKPAPNARKASTGTAAAESRPRGLKSSRPGKTVKRSTPAGPKADQKRAAEEREQAGVNGVKHTTHETSKFLRGQRIDPRRIDGTETVTDLIDG